MANASVDRHQNLLKSCIKELQSCVDYVQQYSADKDQHFNILKDITRQYCEIDSEHSKAQKAREATDRHFDNQENDCTEDVKQIYKKYFDEQPSISSHTRHPIWSKINNVIQGEKPTAAPEYTSEDSDIELQDDDNRSIDEGIIPSQFEPPVDPITKKIIENPCRNRKCGHIYEYSTVIDHLKKIRQNKSKPLCPYIGCANNNMKSSFIVKDDVLKQRIQHYLANKVNQSDEDASANSVIL